jgi:hypothetical protein
VRGGAFSTDTADTAATDTAATDSTETAATDTEATTLGPLEPPGPNPCGSCESGEFCNVVPADEEGCGVTACSIGIGSGECIPCVTAPGECDPQELAQCAAWSCHLTELLGYSIAEDGVLVVRCEIYADTGCGT